MAVPMQITDASRIIECACASSVDIQRGELVSYSSGLILADANVAVNAHCWGIALTHGKDGSMMKLAQSAVLYDYDAPYTANTTQYMSGTAGALTETLPATGGDLIQVVGRSTDTSHVLFDVQNPRLQNLFFPVSAYDTTGEPGLGVVDAGWAGPGLDGAEAVYIVGRLPSNMVELLEARVVVDSNAGSLLDIDWSIVGAYDGSANDEDTGTAQGAVDFTYCADNKIGYMLVSGASALMDAGFALPGRNFSILMDQDAITTTEIIVLGLSVKCLVV